MGATRWFADPWVLGSVGVLLGLLALGYGLILEGETGGLTPIFHEGVFFVLLGLVTSCVAAPIAFGIAWFYRWARTRTPSPSPKAFAP